MNSCAITAKEKIAQKKKILRRRLRLLKQEIKRRKSKKINFLADTFPEQRAFITDKNRLVAALCTRRAAKSYSCGLKLFKTCMENPGTISLFIAKTRDSAERILWEQVVKVIAEKYKVPCTLKYGKLTVEFDNGARFQLIGVDKDEEEMKKLLGGKFKLVVIDEASEYRIDVRKLVKKMLLPAIADLRGQIAMVGTPADMQKGLFYEITRESRRIESINGWSVHSWDTYANPYMKEQWHELITDMIADEPDIENDPGFRQHFKKEWVIDTNALCYKYRSDYNIEILPTVDRSATIRILGIDLGFDDETSFVVAEYYLNKKYMVFRYAKKAEKMLIDEVAETIQSLNKQYQFDHIVIDGAAKQFVQSLIAIVKLNIESADKMDKNNYIKLMNSDFSTGKIKVLHNLCGELINEWQTLLWKRNPAGDKKEDPMLANHLCDGALYAWRYCYHRFYKTKKKKKSEEQRMIEAEEKNNLGNIASDDDINYENDDPYQQLSIGGFGI